MKKLIAFATALLLGTAPYATAAETPAPAKKAPAAKLDKLSPEATAACPKMGMGGGMGMGMMGGAMPPELMQKMQEQMAAIRQSGDPAERQKLMQEHFQSMQEAMQSLRGAGTGGGMPCCCKQYCAQAGGKPGAGSQCARGAGTGMMEQRMDMMQTMMENMLEHQRQMQPTK